MLSRTLEPTSLDRPLVGFDASNGFHSTLLFGLDTCLIKAPGDAGAMDLGLGTSPALPRLLGISDQNPDALYQRWVRLTEPSHPLARYPYVPRGRFCAAGAADLVRSDLESTGPVGWATGHDVTTLASDLRGHAAEKPELSAALDAVAARVEQLAQRGEAVVGFIEYLPPEAEGRRQWLIDPDADGGR